MKTDILKLSFMALAVTAFIVGCTQDGDLVNTTDTSNKVLKITTTVKDFTPDANTRVADEVDPENGNNYITKFEEGDKMGVYAFTNDGTVMSKNLPMTYTAEGKWASDVPLYFYKNATYIAYSPYNANISNVEFTSENAISAITDYFVTTVFTDASRTYAECDLMTASATTDDNLPEVDASAITFNFAHAMSMVEFVIPVKKYKSPTTGYEYSGPVFEVKLQKQEGTGAKVDVTALALGKGVYRSLLAPVPASVADKDMTFHGEMMVGNGTQPVYFSTQTAFKPEAGKYKKVTVSYTNSPDPAVEERDLKVGDYYYSDGGIVPGDASIIPSKNCIGIIYQVAKGENEIIVGDKQRQAYAISVHEVGGSADWGRTDSNIIPRFIDDATADETNDFTAMISEIDGYVIKNALEEAGLLPQFAACNSAATYNAVLPDGTTGWYLPTLAQLAIAFNNLVGTTLNTDSYSNVMVNTSPEQYTALLELFRKVGGNIGNGGDTYCLWTCTDRASIDAANVYGSAWVLIFNSKTTGSNNRKVLAGTLRKFSQNSREMKIRPVFAF